MYFTTVTVVQNSKQNLLFISFKVKVLFSKFGWTCPFWTEDLHISEAGESFWRYIFNNEELRLTSTSWVQGHRLGGFQVFSYCRQHCWVLKKAPWACMPIPHRVTGLCPGSWKITVGPRDDAAWSPMLLCTLLWMCDLALSGDSHHPVLIFLATRSEWCPLSAQCWGGQGSWVGLRGPCDGLYRGLGKGPYSPSSTRGAATGRCPRILPGGGLGPTEVLSLLSPDTYTFPVINHWKNILIVRSPPALLNYNTVSASLPPHQYV